MSLFWRCLTKAGVTGFAGGTLYAIIVGALTFLTGFVNPDGDKPGLLWVVLFIGAGAGVGLLLGAICAASMSVVLRVIRPDSANARLNARVLGAVACGLPVFALTMLEQLTQLTGILEPEFTTVVVIPTVVATIGGAAAAPDLLQLRRPGDPQPASA